MGPTSFAIVVAAKKFRDENPKVFKAVYDALNELQEYINNNKTKSAEILLEAMGGHGWQVSELVEVLNDPDIKFDITPENVMRYATFMADVGSIRNRLPSGPISSLRKSQALPGS